MIKILVLCLLLIVPTAAMPMGGGIPGGYETISANLIGEPAPEFTLELFSGGQKSLASVRDGKKAILMFWSTWCPHCHEELRALSAKLKALEEQGIKLILVDFGETKEQVGRYFTRYKLNLDTFMDEEGLTQGAYNVIGLPTIYFIDAQGIVRNISHHVPENHTELFQ